MSEHVACVEVEFVFEYFPDSQMACISKEVM